jgi:heme oxygenase (biliverdin-IX-beta and delta-forming)
VVVPLEARLESAGVAGVVRDWHMRRRSPALIADLAVLHGAFQPAVVPSLSAHADIIGCLYVLEGSRLGARVLLRTVLEGDDLLCCAATRYLSHGIEQRLWGSFVSFLETEHFSKVETERAFAAASLTFELFARAARNATPQACWNDVQEQASP